MTLLIMLQACQKDESQKEDLLSTNIEETTERDISDTQYDDASDDDGSDDYSTNEEPKDCRSIKGRVINQGNILAFEDMRHFWECSECLAEENDAYNDAYEAQYPNATEEELDELDELNNFDHHGFIY